jgi:hypothetical protein
MSDEEVLATHQWRWEEGSSGVDYEYCTCCHAYREDSERVTPFFERHAERFAGA